MRPRLQDWNTYRRSYEILSFCYPLLSLYKHGPALSWLIFVHCNCFINLLVLNVFSVYKFTAAIILLETKFLCPSLTAGFRSTLRKCRPVPCCSVLGSTTTVNSHSSFSIFLGFSKTFLHSYFSLESPDLQKKQFAYAAQFPTIPKPITVKWSVECCLLKTSSTLYISPTCI